MCLLVKSYSRGSDAITHMTCASQEVILAWPNSLKKQYRFKHLQTILLLQNVLQKPFSLACTQNIKVPLITLLRSSYISLGIQITLSAVRIPRPTSRSCMTRRSTLDYAKNMCLHKLNNATVLKTKKRSSSSIFDT